MPGAKVEQANPYKLLVSHPPVLVKVEVNEVLRGVVYPTQQLPVSARTEDEFGYAEMKVMSTLDFYAGKLCAAHLTGITQGTCLIFGIVWKIKPSALSCWTPFWCI